MDATDYQGPQLRINLKMKIIKTVGTQAVLAKHTSLSEWQISRIVRGWLNPSTSQLEELAQILKEKDPQRLLH